MIADGKGIFVFDWAVFPFICGFGELLMIFDKN